MPTRIKEQHNLDRAPRLADGYRARLFDAFYARQTADNRDLLDAWLFEIQAARRQIGVTMAKSLLASVITFVHEHPGWVPKESES